MKKLFLLFLLQTLLTIPSYGQQYNWAFNIGDYSSDEGQAVSTDLNGNVVTTGTYADPGAGIDFNPSAAINKLTGGGTYIAKYSTTGAFVWAKSIGPGAYVKDMVQDAAGNIFISGNMNSNVDFDPSSATVNIYDGSGTDFFLAKYDINGNYGWAISSTGTGTVQIGSLAIDNSGNLIVCGSLMNSADFDPSATTVTLSTNGDEEVFFAKYNSSGAFLWAKYLATPSVNGFSKATDICIDSQKNIYLSGIINEQVDFDPGAGTNNITPTSTQGSFIAKYDLNGNHIWAHGLGVGSDNPIRIGSDGNLYAAIQFGGTQDFDHSGSTASLTSAGYSDIALCSYDLAGNYRWAKNFGGTQVETISDIFLDPSNNIYVTGGFRSTPCDFDPGAASYNINAVNGTPNIFIGKYTSNGNMTWARALACTNDSKSRSITVNSQQEVFLTGYFSYTTDFNPGTGTANLTPTATNNRDIFLAAYNACPNLNVFLTAEICAGDIYQFGSQILTSPGTYTQSYMSSRGCDSTETLALTVHPLPVINVTNSSNGDVCQGESVTLTASGALSYTWSSGVINGASFTPSSSNSYYVSGTDQNGCIGTNSATVNVHPLPALSHTSNNNTKCSGTCNGLAVVSSSTGTAPFTYSWSPNANNQTGSMAVELCQGTYSVEVNDSYGCSSEETVIIELQPVSNPNVYLTNIAAVDQVNVSSSFASYYLFNLPSSITPNSSNPRNFVDPGKKARFKVECTNKKSNGQSIVSGICKVRSNSPHITVTDSSSALNNIAWNNSAWSADEFEIDINSNVQPGTNVYIDFIVQENSQNYTTSCIAIPVQPLDYSPTTSATIDDDNNPDSHGNNNDICDPTEIIEFYPLMDNVSLMNAEYVRGKLENLDNLSYINIWNNVQGVGSTVFSSSWWNYSFGQPNMVNANTMNSSPEFDFVFNYNASNANNFKLYMVMAGGFNLFQGNALSLVQWSLPFNFNSTSTGISETSDENSVLLFPNPANDKVYFRLNDLKPEQILVYNGIGELIIPKEMNQNFIDLEGKPSGIYFIEFRSGEKSVFRKLTLQ